MKNSASKFDPKVWWNVYKRIRYFTKMYPLSVMAADAVKFPLDYFLDGRFITTIRNLTIAVTHKCNQRCSMCYFHKELSNYHQLPVEIYKRAIDLAIHSHPCIQLSGGEPFMHPNLVEMAAYAKERQLPVQIFTNGTLVRKEIADELVNLGVDYLNMTLLGDETSHPLVAQLPNSYKLLIKNIEYLSNHRRGTKVVLNYTITPDSVSQMEHAIHLVERYHLDGLRFQHYNFLQPSEFTAQEMIMTRLFGCEARTNEIEETVNVDKMRNILKHFFQEQADRLAKINVQWAPTLTEPEMDNWYSKDPFSTSRKCLYPWRGAIVDADGKLYPCSKIYLELGDLRQTDLLDIWNGDRMQIFRKNLKTKGFPACSRCCKL